MSVLPFFELKLRPSNIGVYHVSALIKTQS